MFKQKGNEAEAAVIFELSKLGLPVFKELGDSSSVDLITIVNHKTVTIQVKYCELQNGSAFLQLRKCGPGGYNRVYEEKEFDLFALYIKDLEKVIWITSKEALSLVSSISFKTKKVRDNQYKARNYEDYLDFYKILNVDVAE